MSFGELLAKFRKRARITLRVVAEGLGIASQSYISHIEKGLSPAPSTENIKRLVNILSLSDQEAYDFVAAAFKEKTKTIDLLSYLEELAAMLSQKKWKYHFLTSSKKNEILDSFFQNELSGLVDPGLRDYLNTPSGLYISSTIKKFDKENREMIHKIIEELKDDPGKIKAVFYLVSSKK